MAVLISSGRQQLDNADWSTAVSTGGNLTANSYYLSVQGLNRIGRNLLRKSTSAITVTANDKITITINASAVVLDGSSNPLEGWRYIVVGVSPDDTDINFKQIAKIPLYDPGTPTTLKTFPLTLELTEDNQLDADLTVADPGSLPTTNLVHGMIREVLSLGYYFEYNPESTDVPDGVTILNATVGNWIQTGNNTTFQDLTTNADGSDQDITTLDSYAAIDPIEYDSNGVDSVPVTFWLLNNTNFAVAAGSQIALNTFVAGVNKSSFFSQRIKYTLKGYVDTTAFTLRTQTVALEDFYNLDVEETYRYGNPPIKLPDDLESQEAVVLDVELSFNAIELDGKLNNAVIEIIPEILPNAGVYSPVGVMFGDGIILFTDDLRRIVPGTGLTATALAGEGFVKSYYFTTQPEVELTGFASNTAAQTILINRNGTTYYSNLAIPEDAVQRALVSTVAGESEGGTFSAYTTVATNDYITVTVNYPSDANGLGTIRNDYDDVIRGNSKGAFNPITVNIYVQRLTGGEIRQFTGFVVVPGVSQDIVINDFTTGSVVGSVPSTEFGLFAPGVSSLVPTGGGFFVADDYRVAYTFVYDGDQITDISHAEVDGNIPEANKSITELFDADYWLDPVADLNALRALDDSLIQENVFIAVNSVKGQIYYYDPLDTTPDDGDTYITHTSTGANFIKFAGGGSGQGFTNVTNITALKALINTEVTEFQQFFVTDTNAQYVRVNGTLAENDPFIIRPDDYATVNAYYRLENAVDENGNLRYDTDAITQGTTNLFFTVPEQSKLSELPVVSTTTITATPTGSDYVLIDDGAGGWTKAELDDLPGYGGIGSGGVGLVMGTWDPSGVTTNAISFGTWDVDSKVILPAVTSAVRAVSTPVQKEILYDTDLNIVYYGNGSALGGVPLGIPTITANRTYYVRTDGNDNNTGLVDSSGGAFLTIQRAVDVVGGLNTNGFSVTIQIGDGTYSEEITLNDPIGHGSLSIQGNAFTPFDVHVDASGGTNAFYKTGAGRTWRIQSLRISSNGNGVLLENKAQLEIQNLVLDACTTSHFTAYYDSLLKGFFNYEIIDDSGIHIRCDRQSTLDFSLLNITLTGTRAFTTFVESLEGSSFIKMDGISFLGDAGLATGQRYNVNNNTVLYTDGELTTFLPGNVAGTSTDALYK